MARRYPVTITGYILADSRDELIDILEDVAGTGVNIERAESDDDVIWENIHAAYAGLADD